MMLEGISKRELFDLGLRLDAALRQMPLFNTQKTNLLPVANNNCTKMYLQVNEYLQWQSNSSTCFSEAIKISHLTRDHLFVPVNE